MQPLQSDANQTRQFLSALMPPETCLEIMMFKAQFIKGNYIGSSENYFTTLAGFYDNPHSLVCDAGRLRGVSGFVIPNPIDRAFLASADNKLRKVGKGEAADDTNVVALRWLYLDFDANKPGKEMSSTDAELAATVIKRDRVFLDFPEFREHAMWGCSGNGSWALVRLPDYPNIPAFDKLIRGTVDFFAKNYGGDPQTKNPARLMPLVGTFKCKGSNRPERPWRLASLDSPPTQSDGFDLIDWAKRTLPGEEVADAPQGGHAAPAASFAHYGDRFARYASKALQEEARKVAEAAPNDGNNALHLAAVNLGELIGSGELDRAEVEQALTIATLSRGHRDEIEIRTTLASGIEHGMKTPRSLSHVGVAPARGGSGLPPRDGDPPRGEQPADDTPCISGYEDNPHRLGRDFIRAHKQIPESRTLQFWRKEFHTWHKGAYLYVAREELRAEVSNFVNDEFERIFNLAMMKHGMSSKDNPEAKPPKPIPVSTKLVGDVLQAMSGICMINSAEVPKQPAWIDRESGWPVDEIVPMKNAIVHLPSLARGEPCTRKPTPRLFNINVLDYDYIEDAPEPVEWIKFLRTLWPDDDESIDTLQEWFGLNLTMDTKYQKIMSLIGPPRSGKGTIVRAMEAMIGGENCANIRLSLLEDKFSLERAVDKLAIVIPDGRLSSKSDQGAIAETLLSVSGEDSIAIPRKYRTDWDGKLTARITLVSNELPRLADTSGALANRFIVLRFTECFLGREDKDLDRRIRLELPGIFLWAVAGWKRLEERGYFCQPKSGVEEFESMRDMASPVSIFLEECCKVGPTEEASCQQLYHAWKAWCEANGRDRPGDQALLGKNLRSLIPKLKTIQHRQKGGGPRDRYFSWISLLPPASLIGEPSGEDRQFTMDAEPFDNQF